ncbi:hypothetical protein CAEBREN_23128 [Caenorhabditis brenneri]|uniref:Uncharacterized protein n=1 Tax=Caenorhabditis brenneri TaxID=135651 RepID=G0NK18_CAEBE|nr:hypothetical protein CAEBREN_23128 [Caenorhabditis brenneri]
MSYSDDEEEGLIRSHVIMNNDDELRIAIAQALFLKTASENLIKKRKRQLEILDECRGVEGVVGKKLFAENKEIIRRRFGYKYDFVAKHCNDAFEKALRPLEAPDIRRPPPSHHLNLPPMHIPPPRIVHSSTPLTAKSSSSTTLVTSEMSRAAISSAPQPPLSSISQNHLLPPQVRIKREIKVEPEEITGTKNPTVVEDLTSWRRPYHPVPVPPPRKIFPFVTTNFHPIPPLQMNAANVGRRRTIGKDNSSPLAMKSSNIPSSPPGIVGINVHGLYVGNRPISELDRNTRSQH